MANEKLHSALNYAERGWAVFPLSPFTKVPLKSTHGVIDASRDFARIEKWWKEHPTANVGIACGNKSGVSVIDIDPKNNGDKTIFSLEKNGYIFPQTLTVITPNGGKHLYYKHKEWAKTTHKAFGPGIDLQSTGSPITSPPSQVYNRFGELKEYFWDVEDECFPDPEPLPYWTKKFLQPPPPLSLDSHDADLNGNLSDLCAWLERGGNRPGERNNRLFWAAATGAKLVKRGKVSSMTAEKQLLASAMRIGLPAHEALPTIYSGFRQT